MVLIDDYWSGDPKGTCVVFGGRGFVGRALVHRLLKLRKWIVRVADSAQSLQVDPSTEPDSVLSEAISAGSASYHCVDVRDQSQIVGVVNGSSVVFYLDIDGSYDQDFYTSYMNIVQGAKNIINACRECKVKRLIYESSAAVVFDGSRDIYNANESIPCPWKYKDNKSDLQAQAEALILFANNIDGLLTCALRSSNVFGPGDTEFVPFLLSQAKSGWTKFIIGTGENMSDFTYVENVAHAHVCAEEALVSRPVSVAGKAFFITNNEPIKFWKFVSLIAERLGYQRPLIKLPVWMAHNILLLVSWIHKELGITNQSNTRSTHYIVSLASRTRTFDGSVAREQIGYSPVVSLDEGISKTIESFSHLARDPLSAGYSNLDEPSKADKLLGSGKVADILLWRDEKTTFVYFLSLVVLFYWFFLSERNLVSSAAQLLLTITMICLACGYLPKDLNGFSIPVASSPNFEVEENTVKEAIGSIVSVWNRGFHVVRVLGHGGDWNVFFKVAASLYILKWIALHHCLNLAIGTALVLAFTSFFVYEQYEYQIDLVAMALINRTKNSKGHFMRYLPFAVSFF